jgi:hypothetical protein
MIIHLQDLKTEMGITRANLRDLREISENLIHLKKRASKYEAFDYFD